MLKTTDGNTVPASPESVGHFGQMANQHPPFTNASHDVAHDTSASDYANTSSDLEWEVNHTFRQQPPLPCGFRLLEYRIDSVIGEGGFGITYLATDIHLYGKVAIKEYLPVDVALRTSDHSVAPRSLEDQHDYQRGLDQFLVEARILATFRHHNIVRVIRFFEAHNTAYIVLEYERGQSLKQWWPMHRDLPERDLLMLLQPLLDGLAMVHDAGYLHRDIKPDNIHVRRSDKSLVLLDFGSASQTRPERQQAAAAVTPGYASPEQYDGSAQRATSDVYSLGATLYWMTTGNKPPSAPLRLDGVDPLIAATEAAKSRFSTKFLLAIDAALRLDPADRPQQITQLRKALFAAHGEILNLQEALHAEETGDGGTPASIKSRRSRTRSVVLLLRNVIRPVSWPMSIKMIVAMSLAALLPMVITAYINLQATLTNVSANELHNLEQLARSTAGRLSQLLDDNRHLSTYLGSDEDFTHFLAQPSPAATAAITAKLISVVSANPDVALVTVMNPNGDAIASSDADVLGHNYQFRDYFKRAMENRPNMTGILVSAVDGEAGIYYANPVHADDARIIGVVVLRLRGTAVDDLFDIARLGNHRTPMLIDGDGVVIYHPQSNLRYRSLAPLMAQQRDAIIADQRFGRSPPDDLGMPLLARAMIGASKEGYIDIYSTISKKNEIVGYAPVRGQNWVVSISESRDFFEAPLNRLFKRVLTSVIVLGVIFLTLAILFSRSIVRPIERLIRATHALKNGDYDNATVKVTARDELGRLSRTFNVMIDVLRQREREKRGRFGDLRADPASQSTPQRDDATDKPRSNAL